MKKTDMNPRLAAELEAHRQSLPGRDEPPPETPPPGRTWEDMTEEEARAGTKYIPLGWQRAHHAEMAAEAEADLEERAKQLGYELYAPRRGRPPKGHKPKKSEAIVAKTVKHTKAFWTELGAKAKARGMTPHEAMREAITAWVTAEPAAKPKKSRKAA